MQIHNQIEIFLSENFQNVIFLKNPNELFVFDIFFEK